jgi:regulator of PEP synthase PpsR (kinase-PPPase family)
MFEISEPAPIPIFFLSDSTGITAETMGNALLIQFPNLRFERRLIPFISTVEEARRVVAILDAAAAGPVTPLAFSTAAVEEVRQELLRTKCPLIDFFELHMERVEAVLGTKGVRLAARLHGMGDVKRYNARMAAVEYAIEHDDGQSMRALDKADVILVAPSRCGKTPTTMYLALQHGVFVANYPLVEDDFETAELPRPVQGLRDRCFGMTTTPARLSQVRQPSPSRDQLLDQVRGGDVDGDLAGHEPQVLRRRGITLARRFLDHRVVLRAQPRRS